MIYATLYTDGDRIMPNAGINVFNTEAEAIAYLLSPYPADQYRHETAVIGHGTYSDCWIKTHDRPEREDDMLVAGLLDFAPFRADDLCVQGPGHHPGGRAWWITPYPPVLVIESIEPVEDGGA